MKFISFKNYFVALIASTALISCGGGSDSKTPEIPANVSPIITSMATDALFERSAFVFTANATDSDGSISAYQWQQTTGTEVSSFEDDGATLSFNTPDIEVDEVLTFTLTVTDDDSASTTATLDISVTAYSAIVLSEIIDDGLVECLSEYNNIDMGIESLSCDNHSIQTLTDLSGFPKLTQINITNAGLVDISALETLTQLKSLNLSNNEISETNAIAELDSLTSLNLSHNKISDVSGLIDDLSSLTNLLELN